MLTGERLFTGESTAEILERVVAGEIPQARSINPLVPEPVEAILSRALERASARRFPSAAAMGEACEHFLYDKGYGPTNLTLKQYLHRLFPESAPKELETEEPTYFPVIQASLIPIGDGFTPGPAPARTRPLPEAELTPIAASALTPIPLTAPLSTLPSDTLAPDPGARRASATRAPTTTRPGAKKTRRAK
jgi:hypothetical protein